MWLLIAKSLTSVMVWTIVALLIGTSLYHHRSKSLGFTVVFGVLALAYAVGAAWIMHALWEAA